MMLMPELNLDAVQMNDEERQIANLIVAGQGKNKGRLRAAKPTIKYEIYEHTNQYGYSGKYRVASKLTGMAAYVWRMVAFEISPIGQHHCLPMMAFCDLPVRVDDPEARQKEKQMSDRLNDLARRITSTVKSKPGIARWARAMGAI